MFTSLLAKGWRRAMSVNVGVFLAARAVLPVIRTRGSASIQHTAFDGNPPMPHDVTSKTAMLRLTRCMARELGPHGIGVNNPAPGCTSSEGVLANANQPRRGRQENIGERTVKRDMMKGNLLEAALLLPGLEIDFITGQAPVVVAKVILH